MLPKIHAEVACSMHLNTERWFKELEGGGGGGETMEEDFGAKEEVGEGES